MRRTLTIDGVCKSFGSVRALDDVSIEVGANEVVGLVGENGAGKSTLLKILNGVYQPDAGRIAGAVGELSLRNPLDAEAAGIGMVHQEQSLLLNISVAENLYLGRELGFVRFGKINWKSMHEAARRQLAKVRLDVDPATRTEHLTFAQRQMVELAKALILEELFGKGILILLDEPTSVLESEEIEILFERVRALRREASFVFVSHRIDEVMELADRMYVLRDGRVVGHLKKDEASPRIIHELMVGRSLKDDYYGQEQRTDFASDVILSLDGLSRDGEFEDVSFDVRKGEIVALCGVVGSGREGVLRSLAGLAPFDRGRCEIGGRPQRLNSPVAAVRSGIGYVPKERRVEGLVLPLPMVDNVSLPSLPKFKRYGMVSRRRQMETATSWVRRLSIRPPDPTLAAVRLSGGNQQKVVLAKWIESGARILLLDHPTRGVDVGAKQEVYGLIRRLAGEGKAIILTADTLEEALGLSDTVIVMRDQRTTARFPVSKDGPTQLDIIENMV